MQRVIRGVLLGVVALRNADAQTPCPEPAPDGVVAVCQLDAWDGPLHQPVGAYPPILLQAGVTGRVHVRVRVDSLGRPSLNSLRWRTTHDLFARAVRGGVPEWRFAAPRRAGRGVAVLYEATITFIPVPLEGAAAVEVVPGPDTVTAPLPALNRDRWPARADAQRIAPALFDAQEAALRVRTGALDTLRRRPTVCLTALGGQTPVLTKALSTRALTVTVPTYCPRTYSSMIHYVGRAAIRAPVGWQDPVHLEVVGIEEVRPGLVQVFIEQSQGTGGRRYSCGVQRVGDGWGHAACTEGPRWVS